MEHQFRSGGELSADSLTRRQALQRVWSGIVGLSTLSLLLPETAEAKRRRAPKRKRKEKAKAKERDQAPPVQQRQTRHGGGGGQQGDGADEARRNPIPWHALAQEDRNLLIVGRGYQDVGTSGGECKDWVRKVVEEASNKEVTIPSTTDGGIGCAWYQSPDVGEDRQSRIPRPGEIIQMQLRTADRQPDTGGNWLPHTAIVANVSPTEMMWLDSNWGRPANNRTVRLHPITFQEFNENVLCYTLYYIR